MKIFEGFNPEGPVCPVCKKNDDKSCCLIPIFGKNEGMTYEAKAVHIDCLDPVCFEDQKVFIQNYEKK